MHTGMVQGESVQFLSSSLPLESGSSSYEEQDDLPSPDISFSLTESPSSPQSPSNVSTTYKISDEEKVMQQNWQAQYKKLQEENLALLHEKQALEKARNYTIERKIITIQKWTRRYLAQEKLKCLRQKRREHEKNMPKIAYYLAQTKNYEKLAYIAKKMADLAQTQAIAPEIEMLLQEALQYYNIEQENKNTSASAYSTASSENNKNVFSSNNNTIFSKETHKTSSAQNQIDLLKKAYNISN